MSHPVLDNNDLVVRISILAKYVTEAEVVAKNVNASKFDIVRALNRLTSYLAPIEKYCAIGATCAETTKWFVEKIHPALLIANEARVDLQSILQVAELPDVRSTPISHRRASKTPSRLDLGIIANEARVDLQSILQVAELPDVRSTPISHRRASKTPSQLDLGMKKSVSKRTKKDRDSQENEDCSDIHQASPETPTAGSEVRERQKKRRSEDVPVTEKRPNIRYLKDKGRQLRLSARRRSRRRQGKRQAQAAATAVGASRELPEDLDKFEDLRTNNKIYVDKTAYITKLLKQKPRFMNVCRPRRFGKSNFLQMLKSFFQANRTLFEGLNIYAQHDWQPLPVIYLDFYAMDVGNVKDFKSHISKSLRRIGKSYGHKLSNDESILTLLEELTYELSESNRNYESIIILINEYDWPVRRNTAINREREAWEISNFLKDFFQKIKSCSDRIRMLLATCTMPLQLRNFKDGSDILKDITYDPEFNEMMGLTETELRSNLKSHIEKMTPQPRGTFDSIVENLRKRYNGYCFSKNTTCRLYNFHSVISAVRNQNMINYWHAHVDPQYSLIKDQKEQYGRNVGTLNSFSNCSIARDILESRVDFSKPIPVIVYMVLYGYLTFRAYKEDTDEFVLDFPNEEVREKFMKEILEPVPLGTLPVNEVLRSCEAFRQAMFARPDGEQFVQHLNKMAFGNETKNVTENEATERDYVDHIIRVLQICGVKNQYRFPMFGRNDYAPVGTIHLVADGVDEDTIDQYVFEFGKIEDAMTQLLKLAKIPEFWKQFHNKRVYMMGLDFSEEEGAIKEWIRVTYQNGLFSDLKMSNPKYKKMYAYVTSNKMTTTESILGLKNTLF